MGQYDSMLYKDDLKKEKEGTIWQSTIIDREILKSMFAELKNVYGYDLHYIVDLDFFWYKDAEGIFYKYVGDFQSETTRALIIRQLAHNKRKDTAEIIYDWYLHFKNSSYYISKPGRPSADWEALQYDHAFCKLKSKRIKNKLLQLSYYPRDAYYLPFTMKMLGSWKIPEMEERFLSYLEGRGITKETLGLPEDDSDYGPNYEWIKRQLFFRGMDILRYFPSEKNKNLISGYLNDPDRDIREAAERQLAYYTKKYGEKNIDE